MSSIKRAFNMAAAREASLGELGPALGAFLGAGLAGGYGVNPLAGAAAGYGIGAIPEIAHALHTRSPMPAKVASVTWSAFFDELEKIAITADWLKTDPHISTDKLKGILAREAAASPGYAPNDPMHPANRNGGVEMLAESEPVSQVTKSIPRAQPATSPTAVATPQPQAAPAQAQPRQPSPVRSMNERATQVTGGKPFQLPQENRSSAFDPFAPGAERSPGKTMITSGRGTQGILANETTQVTQMKPAPAQPLPSIQRQAPTQAPAKQAPPVLQRQQPAVSPGQMTNPGRPAAAAPAAAPANPSWQRAAKPAPSVPGAVTPLKTPAPAAPAAAKATGTGVMGAVKNVAKKVGTTVAQKLTRTG